MSQLLYKPKVAIEKNREVCNIPRSPQFSPTYTQAFETFTIDQIVFSLQPIGLRQIVR